MAPTSVAYSTRHSWSGTPRHLSSDHDPLFEAHRWTANLRILEIDEIKTVPHVPLSHPFVERLVGTIRREFLDYVLFWNARDLERKLAAFQAYYNAARSHASLEGHTPLTFAGEQTVIRAELKQCALGLPLPGPGPAPSGSLTTNSRRTGRVVPTSIRGDFTRPADASAENSARTTTRARR
jgi:Integrase core domain